MYITKPIKSHRYSRPLDIHLTTNHFEIKELLDVLYNKYFNTRKKEITKKTSTGAPPRSLCGMEYRS